MTCLIWLVRLGGLVLFHIAKRYYKATAGRRRCVVRAPVHLAGLKSDPCLHHHPQAAAKATGSCNSSCQSPCIAPDLNPSVHLAQAAQPLSLLLWAAGVHAPLLTLRTSGFDPLARRPSMLAYAPRGHFPQSLHAWRARRPHVMLLLSHRFRPPGGCQDLRR